MSPISSSPEPGPPHPDADRDGQRTGDEGGSRVPDEHRRAELVSSLAAVRTRLATACEAAGREPRAVRMIAVTKTFPAVDVATLAELGVLDVGENRAQEARAKVAELAAVPLASALRWHFVGQLQTNKARSVARYASAVHSLDRPELAEALAHAAAARDRCLDVFIQVSLDGALARGGVGPEQVGGLAAEVASLAPALRLLGVMAVAPIDADPDRAFAELHDVSRRLRERFPAADAISAGMSGDLEAAVRHGATHVRIGSALLGRRNTSFS